MNKSESIVKITAALLEAQKAIEPVTKGVDNPYFHSKYADLNAVIDACKDVLNKQGIVVMQPLNRDAVETIFIHTSGEWVSGETMIVSKDASNPQSYGSAVSYARRYGLMSMMLMKAEDDDGNSATGKKEAKVEDNEPAEEDTPHEEDKGYCVIHKKDMKKRHNGGLVHWSRLNEEQNYDPEGAWYWCQGQGWHLSANQG